MGADESQRRGGLDQPIRGFWPDQVDQVRAHPGMVVVEPGALAGIEQLRFDQTRDRSAPG